MHHTVNLVDLELFDNSVFLLVLEDDLVALDVLEIVLILEKDLVFANDERLRNSRTSVAGRVDRFLITVEVASDVLDVEFEQSESHG